MAYTCKALRDGGDGPPCGNKAKFKFGSCGRRAGHDVCGVHKDYIGQLASGSGDGSSREPVSVRQWPVRQRLVRPPAAPKVRATPAVPTTRKVIRTTQMKARQATKARQADESSSGKLVSSAFPFGQLVGSPPTPQMVEAANASQASLMHSINACVGGVRCNSLIGGSAQTRTLSDVFFPDATLEVSHPSAKMSVKPSGAHTVFVDLLVKLNMQIQFESMDCSASSDEVGPCLDMIIRGRYSQNGSAPRPLNVLSRQREHLGSGKLRTAKMRFSCE